MSATPEVRVHLSETSFDALERPLKRCCIDCLCPVLEHPGFFECACGPSFFLNLMGVSYTGGQETVLVRPEFPESLQLPNFEAGD